MRRLLTSLLLLLLVLFFGFKAAVWWLTDQRMAQARSALEQYGVLERGTIASSAGGQLLLHNAYWQDFRLTRPLEITRLEFDAGSSLALLQVLTDPVSLPSFWTLRAEGMGLVVDSTMFRSWVTADGHSGGSVSNLIPLPCAADAQRQLASTDLIRMGITQLTGEMLIRQDVRGLHVELDTFATGSLELDWPGLRLTPSEPDTLLGELTAPLQVTVRDGGLMRRLAAYCAREAGLDVQDWAAQAEAALVRELRNRGARASAPLLDLYRRWLLQGGELSMSLHPRQPWWGIPLRDRNGADNSWRVTYNGKAVADLYLESVPVPAPIATVAESATETGTAVDTEDAGRETWYPLAPDDADTWLGYRVRVTLNNGKQVEGRLESVDDTELAVARPVAGGEVVYPILRRAVGHLEVWHRGSRQGGAEPRGSD